MLYFAIILWRILEVGGEEAMGRCSLIRDEKHLDLFDMFKYIRVISIIFNDFAALTCP